MNRATSSSVSRVLIGRLSAPLTSARSLRKRLRSRVPISTTVASWLMVASTFATFCGLISSVYCDSFRASTTPLRSRISPRFGTSGTTEMRLSSALVR